MARNSSEVAGVMKRLLAGFEARQADVIRSLFSQSEELLVIGSDAREWMYGVEAYLVSSAQATVAAGYSLTYHRLEAHEEGPIGWAAADTTVHLENGRSARFRFTAVFRLESGVWRVVQWHASVPRSTLETTGADVPTSLADLIESLDADVEKALRAKFRTATLTFVFSDIEQSTDHAEAAGDAVWGDIVQRHFAEVQRIAAAHAGSVVKTLGDGAMLVFDAAVDAVLAALEIQRSVTRQHAIREFRVRVGVHTGEALHVDGDYIGRTVNTSARVAAAAAGGQVLVSDAARQLAGEISGVEFGPPVTLDLKGVPGPVTAHPLTVA